MGVETLSRAGVLTGRRTALMAGLGLSPALLLGTARSARAQGSTALQDVTRLGADPTGILDSTAAFVKAFVSLPPGRGGCIYVPAGQYRLNSPLTFAGNPVVIQGDGSGCTTLFMGHSGTALSFAQGGFNPVQPVGISGISIAGPTHGGPAACAIAIAMAPEGVETGYQSCVMEDVSIGSPRFNSTNGAQIQNGIYLDNVWKGVYHNVRMFGLYTKGSTFVTLDSTTGAGKSVDNYFVNCVADGLDVGFAVTNYAEGVYLLDSTIIANTGFTSGTGVFTGRSFNINGLHITGCEFNCVDIAASLEAIWGGSITATHFGMTSAGSAALALNQCVSVSMANLYVTGPYPNNDPNGTAWGIATAGGAANKVNGVTLENLANGIYIGSGTTSSLFLGIQMVDAHNFPHMATGQPVKDASNIRGSGSNNAQWMSDLGTLETLY